VLPPAKVAAAVHHVPLSGEQRAQHRHVVARVVLEVGVLNDQVITGRKLDPRSDRASLSTVALHPPEPHARLAGDDLGGPIARAVVDDDDVLLDAEAGQIDRLDLFQQRADEPLFVEGGNHDRQHPRRVRRAHTPMPRPSRWVR
jgi:hypothetical protein